MTSSVPRVALPPAFHRQVRAVLVIEAARSSSGRLLHGLLAVLARRAGSEGIPPAARSSGRPRVKRP